MSQKRQILMLDQQKSTYLLFKVYPWGVEYFSTLSLDRPRLNIYMYIRTQLSLLVKLMSAMLSLSLQFLLIYLGKSWYYLFWIMPIMTHSRKYFNSQQQYCLKRVNLTEICHFGNQYYLQCFEIFCWIAFLRSTLNKRNIFFLLAEEEKKK